ncbi:hypothetical protein F4777DRAFT_194283 [Nemania sp. FL0916]|nr:hypothetical protein F4777DRAFT_194283 [Nemania sp. FL0916]
MSGRTAFRTFPLKSASPSSHLPRLPTYAFASRAQAALQQELLAWKARPPDERGPSPPPSLIFFTPPPTYTLGRRQTEPLTASEMARLQSPLFVPTRGHYRHGASEDADSWSGVADGEREGKGAEKGGADSDKTAFFLPTIERAPRGGLATYHGPGQLVIWPVIDLHSPWHARLSVRDYACLLEKTTIAALHQQWGLNSFTTENPGVWVRSPGVPGVPGSPDFSGPVTGDSLEAHARGERKIAALGVHLRRHVTGLGVAINYSTPVTGPTETNPWSRIVACGLGDRGVTSVCTELRLHGRTDRSTDDRTALDALAETWRAEFQRRLKIHQYVDDLPEFDFDADRSQDELQAQVQDYDNDFVRAQPIQNLAT